MVLRLTGYYTEVVLVAPRWCRNGHRLKHPNVRLHTEHRDGGELRICWTCQTCGDVIADDEVKA